LVVIITHTHTHTVWGKNKEYLALNLLARVKQRKAVRFHSMGAFTGQRSRSPFILDLGAKYR